MKLAFPRGIILLLGVASLMLLLIAALLYRPIGGDFTSRYNEVTSVLDRKDPFLVWSGQVVDERYYPYNQPDLRKNDGQSHIHAYTPWSYTYISPIVSCLSLNAAWNYYRILMVVALILIGWFAYDFCRARGTVADGVLGIAAAFALGATYGVTFIYGNYGIIISALFALMVWFLNRRRDVLAGVCWALAMTKPQCAMLLAIPLLLQRRWKTIVTAVAICLTASIVPAVFCGRSPVDMILQVRKLGTGFYSGGTAIFPNVFVGMLVGPGCIEAHEFLLPINAALGISLCAVVSWMVRKSKDWIVLLSPAILFSAAWTYLICFDRCIFAVPAVALAAWAIRSRTPKAEWIAAFGISVLFGFGIMPLCMCDGFLQKIFGLFGRSYPVQLAHCCLSWIDAVVGYLLVIGVCIAARMISKRDGDGEGTTD